MAQRLQLADLAGKTSFGTFKPTGYAVLAYRDEDTARAAADRLARHGIADGDVLMASSDTVFPHVDGHMDEATRVAGAQGYEVVLMKRYLDLAARDAWWLLVWAPDDEHLDRLKGLIGEPRPLSAAHYGRLLIEDLSEPLVASGSAVDAAVAKGRERRDVPALERERERAAADPGQAARPDLADDPDRPR